MHLGSKVLVAVAAHANATAGNRMAKHKSAITVQIVVAFLKDGPRCETMSTTPHRGAGAREEVSPR